MNLYRVTRRTQIFYVVAEDPTSAQKQVQLECEKADWFNENIDKIELIAMEPSIFPSSMQLTYHNFGLLLSGKKYHKEGE
jgi:hypothetical protein